MIDSILVPVDGSEGSRKALDIGCALAERFDADLSLLHVVQPSASERTLVLGGAAITIHCSADELQDIGDRVLDAASRRARSRGVSPRRAVRLNGDPAQQIIEFAANHGMDAIVMGSRGLGDLGGLLLGSVSHKVSHLAKCTCMTVR